MLRSFSKTSVLLAVIAGILLLGLGGYYAYKRGVFASTPTETKGSAGCTITLSEDIKKDANSDRFSIYFGPRLWEKNLTEIEILRSELVIRNNKRILKVNEDVEKAGFTGFSRNPEEPNSSYKYVDSDRFSCSKGKAFTVKADLRWASKSIVITESGSKTSTGADSEPAVSEPEETTGEASTQAETGETQEDEKDSPKTTDPGNTSGSTKENNINATDSGSTFAGIVKVTVKTGEDVPVRSAKVTATTSTEAGRITLGECSTSSDGICELRLHSSSASLKIDSDAIINYLAEKNAQSATEIRLLQDSINEDVELEIKGLTQEEASEYQDAKKAENTEELEIPIGKGFIGGNSSATIIPTRFTRAGSTATTNGTGATAIGGVSFTLKAYYSSTGKIDNAQTQYKTPAQAFTYTTSNSLQSLIGQQQNKNFYGKIPDNGANSQLKISNLPAGNYLLTLEKSGFQSTNITFSLTANENKSAFLVNMRPTKGAEPPSLSQQRVIRKEVDKNTYWAQINSSEYQYKPDYPWYGWQPQNNFITSEPSYSTTNNYIPQVESAPTTQGGYNTPWEMTANGLANYLNNCQTMNFGQGVDSKDAAIAAAIGGLGNWLFGDETKNLESFAETTLVPGLVTYFAAEAMEESGGSISLSAGNSNCFPISSSPYQNSSYTNQYQYNYPNGYSTSNIPSECLRCLGTPPIIYDPNWCPSHCQNYLNTLGVSPLINIALNALLGQN